MFVQYLVAFYFFCAMISSAPLLTTQPQETSSPNKTVPKGSENNETLPDISPPEPVEDPINPETLGGVFEGDIAFPDGFDPTKARGVALIGPHSWPNSVIPYDISGITSSSQRNTIVNAMNTLMYAVGTPVQGQTTRRSCVYFRPKLANERDFVKIVYGTGCSATPGYWPGSQMTLTLQNPDCFVSGTIQHELIHTLGFYHEHSRPDRDSYITVNFDNIQSGQESNFQKYVWGSSALYQNTPYEYGSIMHYGTTAFSRNGQAAIVPKRSGVTIGQRVQLSSIDITEIRSLYKC